MPQLPPLHRLRLAALALVGLAVAPFAEAQDRPPAPVVGVRAEMREVVQRERVIGSLRAESDALLAALEAGPVAEVAVRAGSVVSQGDVIVRLDTRRLEAQRAELRASLAEAEAVRVERMAEADDAQVDLEALERAGADAVSERDLRRARTAKAVADARRDAAVQRVGALEAQLSLANVRLSDAVLRAPFDGVVTAKHVEIGEWVAAGDGLVELVSAARLEVWLDVPERFLDPVRRLRGDLVVAVGADGTEVATGGLRVVPRVDPSTRTFPVIATLPSREAADMFSAGMSASAWLAVGEARPSLLVPKDALVYRPGGVSVMVVRGPDGANAGAAVLNGAAAQVPIVVAFETEREVAIAPGGLVAGDVVVVEGNERLMPGTSVAATIVDGDAEGAGR